MYITVGERQNGLAQGKVLEAVHSIKDKGFVVLENLLCQEYVEQMKDKILQSFKQKRERLNIQPSDGYSLIDYPGIGGNHGFNRWNLRLPSSAPFIDNRLLGNPVAHAIFSEFFDTDPVYTIMACDMNAPRSTFQKLHRDRPSFALIMNVPLVDMTMENGATNIFPGTHRMPGKPFQKNGAQMHCPVWPPKSWQGEFLCVKAGTVIIRDVRMAHRGMVNNSDEPRPLININVCAPEHDHVPYHSVSSYIERMGRLNRQKSLQNSDGSALRYWNGIGQTICHLAKSDRINKRAIKSLDWQSLNADAKKLLRFAQVEGFKSDAYKKQRSLKPTLFALEAVFGGMKNRSRTNDPLEQPVGLVKPEETRLIEALRKNNHTEEDMRVILEAMKHRGIQI